MFIDSFVLFFQTGDLDHQKRASQQDNRSLGKGKFLDFSEITGLSSELTLIP